LARAAQHFVASGDSLTDNWLPLVIQLSDHLIHPTCTEVAATAVATRLAAEGASLDRIDTELAPLASVGVQLGVMDMTPLRQAVKASPPVEFASVPSKLERVQHVLELPDSELDAKLCLSAALDAVAALLGIETMPHGQPYDENQAWIH